MSKARQVEKEQAEEIYARVQEHHNSALEETRELAQRLDKDSALRARAKVPSNPPPPMNAKR